MKEAGRFCEMRNQSIMGPATKHGRALEILSSSRGTRLCHGEVEMCGKRARGNKMSKSHHGGKKVLLDLSFPLVH